MSIIAFKISLLIIASVIGPILNRLAIRVFNIEAKIIGTTIVAAGTFLKNLESTILRNKVIILIY